MRGEKTAVYDIVTIDLVGVFASTLDLLQKSIFAPLAPQFWGEPEFKVPQFWGI